MKSTSYIKIAILTGICLLISSIFSSKAISSNQNNQTIKNNTPEENHFLFTGNLENTNDTLIYNIGCLNLEEIHQKVNNEINPELKKRDKTISSQSNNYVNDIKFEIKQIFKKKRLKFNLVNSIEEVPDFVFIFYNGATQYSKEEKKEEEEKRHQYLCNKLQELHCDYKFINLQSKSCSNKLSTQDGTGAKKTVKERENYNEIKKVEDDRLTRKAIKRLAKDCVKFIQQKYFSGEKPVYSTVFTPGENGYKSFRIPSVLTLPSGRILAIIEARGEGKTDCAENDIVLKYSDNEGKSWSDMILIAASGKASLNNPTSLYIKENNRILIIFQEYPPKMNEALTDAGYKGNITRTYITYSEDDGLTWSEKRDITKQVKQPMATGYASGPGTAIRVTTGPDKGRILVPLNVSGGSDGWFNYLISSDDLGENWKIVEGKSEYGTNESQIVQISETEFLINARCHRYPGNEIKSPTEWNPWNFSKVTRCRGCIPVQIKGEKAVWGKTQLRYDLPDPLCQGAIYRYSGLQNDISRLIFVNAANNISLPKGREYRKTPPARINGTIRISYDEGKTWKYSKRFYGNRFTNFMYSVPTRLKSNKIGVLFEAGGDILFSKFDLTWLAEGNDAK